MPFRLNPQGGWIYTRNHTYIPYEGGERDGYTPPFVWPPWAIERANTLLRNGLTLSEVNNQVRLEIAYDAT